MIALGFLEKTTFGDHRKFFLEVMGHPETDKLTIQVSFDSADLPPRDLKRVKRLAKLEGDVWELAVSRKLTATKYMKHLHTFHWEELVIPSFVQLVLAKKAKGERS